MKRLLLSSFIALFFSYSGAQETIETSSYRVGTSSETDNIMSKAYWDLWNPEVQAKIDHNIELFRKADAVLDFENLPPGAEVKVEQISHDLIFGAHIFNFNQLGTVERNQKYKELFGTLFNSATIAFYWKPFEMQPNRPRFKGEYWDTEEYWNQIKDPNKEPHWRRPATDPVVEFCEKKGIRLHGHTITWGTRKWQHPEWLFGEFCPEEEKEKINSLSREELYKLTPSQIEELIPTYSQEMNRLMNKRIVELANYYGDRLHSWDVVNESATDFGLGRMIPGDKICKSHYGLMPGDYTFESFKKANRVFPSNVRMNINDYKNDADYTNQVIDLRDRGCKIDIMGSQMHLFNPQQCLDIANGKAIETPEIVWNKMETLSKAGLPIHLSEITITSPGDDKQGREIQAVIARNLYRLWFSIEKMMGITWWNVVDGCGAPGEPTISGLFTRNMEPKPSFYALNQLINEEWKTKRVIKVREDGTATFRGFKGWYIVCWKDKSGKIHNTKFYLKKDGDGFQTFK
ncbi:endo-1,4-beta-xylanase [Mariniphaga sediminis]|uniref:endo-1,4-beta-xylanase n=1 Tax=Mariniphaga sediminis TaxID=1628158 RepID=UPI00356572F9